MPPNKPQETVDTPQNFFFYGATMSGKSYLAGEFPNPLFLDTDGNASANPHPSVSLRNIRNKRGNGFQQSVIEQLDQIILELQTTDHSYETIVLDVIDDIVVMIEQYITVNAGVDSLGDIGYGKGYAAFNNIFQQLVIDLKSLPVNVIYVSRIKTWEDNGIQKEEPSLKEKHVNIVNGNCDYMIQTKKVGKNYLRTTKMKRKNYQPDKIEDERILDILESVTGAFDKTRKTSRKKQDKIVKKMEAEEEARFADVEEEEEEDEPMKPKKPTKLETKPEAKAKQEKMTLDDLKKKSKEAAEKEEAKKTQPKNTEVQGVVRSRKKPQI